MEGLTERQQKILDFIRRHIVENGYPPTVREIGAAFGIRSTNGVADHLKSLERKGYLSRGSLKSRALRPLGPDPAMANAAGVGGARANVTSLQEHRAKLAKKMVGGDNSHLISVRLCGTVAAGAPILAVEEAEDSVQIDSVLLGNHPNKRVFALKIKGDSMIGDGIFDGDYIFVRKQLQADDGDIVVAMIEGDATVKRVYREGDRVRFQPSNPKMAPIYVHKNDYRETMLLGLVVGVYRRL